MQWLIILATHYKTCTPELWRCSCSGGIRCFILGETCDLLNSFSLATRRKPTAVWKKTATAVHFKRNCCGAKTKFKKIDDSLHKPYCDRVHKRIQENLYYAKRMSKIRSKTVDSVLGTLINFTNKRRVNTRGIQGANKHVLMAALTYNLRKHMKFCRLKAIAKAVALSIEIRENLQLLYDRFIPSITPFRSVHFYRQKTGTENSAFPITAL